MSPLFGNDRQQMRQVFITAWDKAHQGQPLEPLEHQLVELIAKHPEYHAVIEQPEAALDRDFTAESGQANPFLHLGLHMAVIEQVTTDRPTGIRDAFQTLCQRLQDVHAAEHAIMELLGEALWRAQRDRRPPDESAYLTAVRRAAGQPDN